MVEFIFQESKSRKVKIHKVICKYRNRCLGYPLHCVTCKNDEGREEHIKEMMLGNDDGLAVFQKEEI